MYVCNGVLFGHKNKWNTDNMRQQGQTLKTYWTIWSAQDEACVIICLVFNTNLHGPGMTTQIFMYHVTHSKVLICEGRI